jgi:hypothetical protein
MSDEELKRLFEAMEQRNAAAHQETRRQFKESTEQITRHFDVTSEAMRHDVQLVAEAVTTLDEKLTREVTRLDEKMDRGFAETQAMIRFSHVELERRVRSLEQIVTDLQSRVERLEATTN